MRPVWLISKIFGHNDLHCAPPSACHAKKYDYFSSIPKLLKILTHFSEKILIEKNLHDNYSTQFLVSAGFLYM